MKVTRHNGFYVYRCSLGSPRFGMIDFDCVDVTCVEEEVSRSFTYHDVKEEDLKQQAINILGNQLYLVKDTPVVTHVLVNEELLSRVSEVNDLWSEKAMLPVYWQMVFFTDGYIYFTPSAHIQETDKHGLTWTEDDAYYDVETPKYLEDPVADQVFDVHPVRAGKWRLWPPPDLLPQYIEPTLVDEEYELAHLLELREKMKLVEVGAPTPIEGVSPAMSKLRQALHDHLNGSGLSTEHTDAVERRNLGSWKPEEDEGFEKDWSQLIQKNQ